MPIVGKMSTVKSRPPWLRVPKEKVRTRSTNYPDVWLSTIVYRKTKKLYNIAKVPWPKDKHQALQCTLKLYFDQSKKKAHLIATSLITDRTYFDIKITNNIDGVNIASVLHEKMVTISVRKPAIDIAFRFGDYKRYLYNFLYNLKLHYDDKSKEPMPQPIDYNPPRIINLSYLELISVSLQVFKLDKLVLLDLSNNSIEDLSDSLQYLECLRELLLSGNKLGMNKESTNWMWLREKKLQRTLKSLDLSNNNFTKLPDELGDLTLETLKLSKNQLVIAEYSQWNWVRRTSIQMHLKNLDLSYNDMTQLPRELVRFQKLQTLILSNNKLRRLPQWMGSFVNGAGLNIDLRENSLIYIPTCFARSKVRNWIHNIPKQIHRSPIEVFYPDSSLPSLKEFSARTIINHRVTYDPNDLPQILREYLEDAVFCECGNSCFECFSTRITHSSNKIPMEYLFCSRHCFEKYVKIKRLT